MTPTIDILLVDDEPRNLDALEAILTEPGYRLLRADDANRALRLLLENQVAAIVLDIKMPGVDGLELAHLIKKTKRFRETPIVFLTAYMVDDQDIIAGYGVGAVDYLTKPVNPQILRRKVAVFADLYRKTRELAELNEKLEERVKERTAELEKSDAALRVAANQKDEFLAVLAHELRNPLAPLRTGLDLLLRRQLGGERGAGTLAAMNRQLDHMVRLVDDLLDVSRISRGFMELKKELVDVGTIIQSAVDSTRPFFDRRKQSLVIDAPAGRFAVADATRVTQILTNLLNNAAKFTPEGGHIRIELECNDGILMVRVADSGAGIPAEELDRVFDMFARLDRPGVIAGSGLGIGLALARRLAEMHGGSLTVQSAGAGLGSTFTLSLPAAAAVASTGTSGSTGTPSVAPLKIVIIEDNDDVADTLMDWFEELGHRVWVARTGRSGVERVTEARPNLVLCDLGLPEMDGLSVCRSVRALDGGAEPLMVALTGWGREADLQRTKDAGFDLHIVKPVAPKDLQRVLQTASARGSSDDA